MPVRSPRLWSALVLLCTAALVRAAEPPAALPTGGSAPWGADPLARAVLLSPSPVSGSLRILPAPADAPVAGTLLELHTAKPTDHPWSLQATIPSSAPLAKGDVLFVECYLRTVAARTESGEALTTIVIESDHPPFTKAVSARGSAPAGGGWLRHASVGRAGEDFAAGKARLNLQFGFDREQTIQIAGLRIVDLGPGVDPATLPVPRVTYPGMAADAPWRAAAAARIEHLRKGDLAVTVVDAAGTPVAGAMVHAEMQRHAFPFGSAVVPGMLLAPGADGDHYRAWVLRNCGKVVLENQLKWGNWERGAEPQARPDEQRATTFAALTWLEQHGIQAKGHNLVWPGWRNLPPRIRAMAGDSAALRAACDAHIADVLNGTAPYHLVEWDVVNEAYANHDLTDALGRSELARWFTLARAAYPVGGLLYNDYAPLDPDREGAFRSFVEDLVLELKKGGAPLTGLGIQAHYGGSSLTDPTLIAGELARIGGKLGVDLAITEFDLAMDPRSADVQATFTRDFLTVCFAEPRVTSFLMWGFWAGAHWKPDAALFAKDWTPRPNARAWDELVHGAWWTDASGSTAADGRWAVRGFKGAYRVTVTAPDGRSTTVDAAIGDAPGTLRVTLPR